MIGPQDATLAGGGCFRAPRAIATLLVAMLACDASAREEGGIVSADRFMAERLVEQAGQADEKGDSRTSRRLLLRAARWDPTRHRDYQQAIDGLSRKDPQAALRHAKIALLRDPEFGARSPALLLRLVAAASEDQAWATASALARRHRDVVFGQPGVSRRRQAELELAVSRLEFLAGEIERASDGFDRLRRLRYGVPIGAVIAGQPVPWQFAASCHLAASHPDRAEDAIDLLARQRGPFAEVESLRARLSLARGEPLAAIRHATLAIESSPDAEPVAGFDVLIEAFTAANQTAQASDWLQPITQRDPEAVAPSVALAEVLTLLGKDREAWIENRRLMTRLLALNDPFDPLLGEIPEDPRAAERRGDLALVAERWLATSLEQGEIAPMLESLPALAARLGGLEPIAAAIDEALANAPLAEAARVWLTKAGEPTDPAAGLRRAGTALARRLGEEATYQSLVRSRINRALRAKVELQRIDREVRIAVLGLADPPANTAAQELLAWTIDRLADTEASRGEDAGPVLAGLRRELAELIAGHLPEDAAARRDAIEQATDLLQQVREDASDGDRTSVDAAELFVLARCGLREGAIEAGERAWRAGRSARQGAAGALLHRDTGLLLEETLAGRAAPGDRARRIEVLEAILDAWPDHAETLLRLAVVSTEQGQHLSRAERMVRRVLGDRADRPMALAALAGIRERLGDIDEAAALLRRAIEAIDAGATIEPGEERRLRRHYAEVLATLGRAEQAAAQSSP